MEATEIAQSQEVISRGIFHGLPTFPSSLSGLSAVVVGASGISGQHMLQVLSQSPSRWRKVYALARSLPHIPQNAGVQIVHVPLDLMRGPEEVATALKAAGVKA